MMSRRITGKRHGRPCIFWLSRGWMKTRCFPGSVRKFKTLQGDGVEDRIKICDFVTIHDSRFTISSRFRNICGSSCYSHPLHICVLWKYNSRFVISASATFCWFEKKSGRSAEPHSRLASTQRRHALTSMWSGITSCRVTRDLHGVDPHPFGFCRQA